MAVSPPPLCNDGRHCYRGTMTAAAIVTTLGMTGLVGGGWRWGLLRDSVSARIVIEGAVLVALGALGLP